jgi:hypothetical protein
MLLASNIHGATVVQYAQDIFSVTKICCHPIFNHKQFVSLAIVCVFL